MDLVLCPHAAYAAAYLNYVISHSNTSVEHVQRVSSAWVDEVGWSHHQPEEVCSWTEGGTVSGVPLGLQAGKSQVEKTAAVAASQKRDEVVLGARRVQQAIHSGLRGADQPPDQPDPKRCLRLVMWTEQCQVAFEKIKQAVCGEPLLHTPNLSLLG